MDMPWLYRVHPLTLFAIFLVIQLAAVFVGNRIGRRLRGAAGNGYGLHGLDSATLGLLALLIGFTLAMALTRFEARREGALLEANAIGTTWLRARLLPEPYRTETDRLLRAYVQLRLDLIRAGSTEAALAVTIPRSDAVQAALWAQATALAAVLPQPVPTGLFIQSLNETIDLQQTRISAATNHVPVQVFALLAVVAMLASGFTAYSGGLAGSRSIGADLIASVLIVSMIVTIFDLDNPRRGFIQVSQQPILALAASMGMTAR